jgi:hypothetical protein
MTDITLTPAMNPWARISEVAARLGVKPRAGGPPTIVAVGADGENYDIWEVVIAFIDQMQKVPDRVGERSPGQSGQQ